VFDISGANPFVLNVRSSQPTNYNVLARNANDKGIVLYTDDTSSQIRFFNDTPIDGVNNNGLIQYTKPGIMTIDVSDNTNILSKLSVSTRPAYSHVFNETAVIYDISDAAVPYLYPVYQKSTEATGNALSLIATDSSSNTFMNIVSTNKTGLSIGGGAYPNDQKRSMGSIGLRDSSGTYTPTVNIVSGTSHIRQKTTLAINNHSPETENYTLDINGPIHLKNGELTITKQANFEILKMHVGGSSNQFAVAIGAPYYVEYNSFTHTYYYRQQILYTHDGGENWITSFDLSGTTIETARFRSKNSLYSSYVYDDNFAVIAGDNGFVCYSYQGGTKLPSQGERQWPSISLPNGVYSSTPITAVFIGNYPSNTAGPRVFLGYKTRIQIYSSPFVSFHIYWFDTPNDPHNDSNGFSSQYDSTNPIGDNPNRLNGTIFLPIGSAGITGIAGDNSGNIYIISTNSIYVYTTAQSGVPADYTAHSSPYLNVYKSISCKNQNVVAVGVNIITYSSDSGQTWTDITYPIVYSPKPFECTLNSVYVYDSSNAMAVGNGGLVLYTSNGYKTWSLVPDSILNSGGNAARLTDSAYNLTNIGMVNLNNFIITKTITGYNTVSSGSTGGNTSVFNGYFPNLFNNVTNYVLDVSGSIRVSGDININDSGKLASNNTTFNLLNNGVKYINMGGDASSVIMGNVTNSLVTVNRDLTVLHDLSTNGIISAVGNLQCYSTVRSVNYESIDPCGNIFIGGLNSSAFPIRQIKIGNFNNPPYLTFNKIYITGPSDELFTYGKISNNSLTQTINAAGGPSNGAGTIINDVSPNFGYYVVSINRDGYLMKAPLSQNIVKFDISGLVLPSSTPVLSKIITLSPTPPSEITDSSYVVGVSSIDISNVFLKNYTYPGASTRKQIVDTSMSILGIVSMNKYLNNDIIPNAQLDVSGNVAISKSLSIGTGTVSSVYTLEVNGPSYISGGDITINNDKSIIQWS